MWFMKPLQDYLGVGRTETPMQGTVYSIQLSKGSLQKCRRCPSFPCGLWNAETSEGRAVQMAAMFLFYLGKGRQTGSHILGQVSLELRI